MSDLYFDTNRGARLSTSQLAGRGLFRSGVDQTALGIVPLIANHGFDTDIYIPVDTGSQEIKEDGKAYIIYDKQPRQSDPDTGFDIRQVLKDKVHDRRDQIFFAGLDFEFESQVHKLQTRDAVDLVNWTNVLAQAQALTADTPIKIRTEADDTLLIPAGQMVTLISAGIAYRSAVMDASWSIKDQIDQAGSDDEAISAYEAAIDTGWPPNNPITIA